MGNETRDNEKHLIPAAMQMMVAKAVETAMNSFLGWMMKAMDEKLNEALTPSHNLSAKADSSKTDATPPMLPPHGGHSTSMLPYTSTRVSLPERGH